MILCYDGSFEGLLSCIFRAVKQRIQPEAIVCEALYQPSLLDEYLSVPANEEQAERVLTGLSTRAGKRATRCLFNIFLSELPEREWLSYQLVLAIISGRGPDILNNYANPVVLRAAQIEKMIHREVHRMHAFVRFQKTHQGLFYAWITPDFNVLPLIGDHFEKRYADQDWLIFDVQRDYGILYDKTSLQWVEPDHPLCQPLLAGAVQEDATEENYQQLWQTYFHAVNISARNNAKLHLRHLPRRYWKYLTEKWV